MSQTKPESLQKSSQLLWTSTQIGIHKSLVKTNFQIKIPRMRREIWIKINRWSCASNSNPGVWGKEKEGVRASRSDMLRASDFYLFRFLCFFISVGIIHFATPSVVRVVMVDFFLSIRVHRSFFIDVCFVLLRSSRARGYPRLFFFCTWARVLLLRREFK